MKIYVVCDLEGTAGVVDFKLQCMADEKYYQQAIRLATLELNALIDGALEGGATEVYAWPGHGAFPGGVDVELVHPECKLVMHAGDAGPVGFDESFDTMFQCGLHAMAGAENGVLSHSFMPFLKNVWLNGVKIGEIGMNVISFGEVGVPSVFISGDQAAVDEAKTLVPDIEGAVVKWGLEEKHKLGALSVRKVVSLSPEKARRLIRETARKAMDKIGRIEPFKFNPPYTMKVQYTQAKYTDQIMRHEGIERINKTTVEQVKDKLSDLIF